MYDILISKEQARQFAFDCFDVIIRDIKNMEEKELEENIVNEQNCKSA